MSFWIAFQSKYPKNLNESLEQNVSKTSTGFIGFLPEVFWVFNGFLLKMTSVSQWISDRFLHRFPTWKIQKLGQVFIGFLKVFSQKYRSNFSGFEKNNCLFSVPILIKTPSKTLSMFDGFLMGTLMKHLGFLDSAASEIWFS